MGNQREQTPDFYELWMKFQGRGVLAQNTNSIGDAADQFHLAALVAASHEDGTLCQAHSLVSLALIWLMIGDYIAAIQALDEAMKLREGWISSNNSLTGEALHLMANAYRGLGQFEEAARFYTRAWTCLSKLLPKNHDYLTQLETNWLVSNSAWERARKKAG